MKDEIDKNQEYDLICVRGGMMSAVLALIS